MNAAIFQKEFTLPPFSWCALIFAIFLIFLPNVLFLLLAWHTETARPLINLDYLAPMLLFACANRWLKRAGVLLFAIAVLFDVLMFVMQLFPFMDIRGALYLAPFIAQAPILYRLLVGVAVGYLLLAPLFFIRLAKQTNFYHTLMVSAVLVVAGYFTGMWQYYERPQASGIFGGHNFYYAKSQFQLYAATLRQDFFAAARTSPEFSKLTSERAANYLAKPSSHKILYIVNESWGSPMNADLQAAVLRELKQGGHVRDWQQGHFHFVGATVQGEMRELCNVTVVGFSLGKAPQEKLAQCLPNVLANQGYATMAMHGATGQLYDRFRWYPKAGFQQMRFSESFLGKPRCQAFNGVCDRALFDEVGKAFAQHDKLFFYWITLTTHSTYDEVDLFDKRLRCSEYGFPDGAILCRNFRLQAQFFDGLAKLIAKPQMKGVEVMVVGDHAPPTSNLGENFQYMNQGDVAWVHFKVQ